MKNKLIAFCFLLVIFSISIMQIVSTDQKTSPVERRNLTTIDTLKKDFSGELENYLNDQIPLRNTFLKLDQIWNRILLRNKEHNGIYTQNDYLIEKLYPLNEKSVTNFINHINQIKEKYLQESNVYYAMIPDKSSFLETNLLKIDHQMLYNELKGKINIPEISIQHLFHLEDYYKTDIHLKQEAYFKILDSIIHTFQLQPVISNYQEKTIQHFKGSSFYKVPFASEEEIKYYDNSEISKATVKHLEYNDHFVYERKRQTEIDPYNIFLSGPSSFVEIANSQQANGKELIIFRDSFASSLAPLLIPYYQKITLIDLRYININYIAPQIDFQNKDVLFLYSTLIVNNSFTLKT